MGEAKRCREEATYVNTVGIKNRLKGKHNEIISSSINWKDGGEKGKRKKDYWWGKKKINIQFR